jgi:hypothetical protein
VFQHLRGTFGKCVFHLEGDEKFGSCSVNGRLWIDSIVHLGLDLSVQLEVADLDKRKWVKVKTEFLEIQKGKFF